MRFVHSTSSAPQRLLAKESGCEVARWWNAKAHSNLQDMSDRSSQFDQFWASYD